MSLFNEIIWMPDENMIPYILSHKANDITKSILKKPGTAAMVSCRWNGILEKRIKVHGGLCKVLLLNKVLSQATILLIDPSSFL